MPASRRSKPSRKPSDLTGLALGILGGLFWALITASVCIFLARIGWLSQWLAFPAVPLAGLACLLLGALQRDRFARYVLPFLLAYLEHDDYADTLREGVPLRLGGVVVAGIFALVLPVLAACIVSRGVFFAGLADIIVYAWLARWMVARA